VGDIEVAMQFDQVPVVESCSAYGAFIDLEAEGADEVQGALGGGT